MEKYYASPKQLTVCQRSDGKYTVYTRTDSIKHSLSALSSIYNSGVETLDVDGTGGATYIVEQDCMRMTVYTKALQKHVRDTMNADALLAKAEATLMLGKLDEADQLLQDLRQELQQTKSAVTALAKLTRVKNLLALT